MNGTADPPVQPAATVVLLRPAEAGFEIFFVKRHSKSAFMPGTFVFPGGRVDAADQDPELLARLADVDLEACCARMRGLHGQAMGQALAGAHLVAAIRETFEEAGVLLARSGQGEALGWHDPAVHATFEARRRALNAGEADFASVCREEDLALDGLGMRYFAHWVTPKGERRRFDARFFLAHAPAEQRYAHDEIETTESCWMSPAAALEAYARGDVALPPPTWSILHDLAELPTVEAAMAWAVTEPVVPTIAPFITSDGGTFALALPGDHLHPDGPASGRDRIVLDGGRRWRRERE